MPDELFSHHDAFHVSAVADVKQHVGDAGGRGFLEGRKYAPYPVDLDLHLLLFIPNPVSSLGRRILVPQGCIGICSLWGQPDIPEFVDHITLWVPVLILTVPKDLHKLFQDCRLTAIAPLRVLGGVVIVAIDLSLVFVVAVLGTKDGGAHRAGEMFNMIFAVESGNVGTAKSTTTFVA